MPDGISDLGEYILLFSELFNVWNPLTISQNLLAENPVLQARNWAMVTGCICWSTRMEAYTGVWIFAWMVNSKPKRLEFGQRYRWLVLDCLIIYLSIWSSPEIAKSPNMSKFLTSSLLAFSFCIFAAPICKASIWWAADLVGISSRNSPFDLDSLIQFTKLEKKSERTRSIPVSYTHLTLPTICSV